MPDDYTALLTGSNWNGIEVYGKSVIVTFSFPTAPPGYVAGIDDANLTPAALASWQAFSLAEQAMARAAMAEWGAACGLVFIEVAPGKGDINFQKLDLTGTGYAGAGGIGYRPFGDWDGSSFPNFTSDLDGAGDVFMNAALPVVYGTLLHEIGHALGLKHPTEAWTQYATFPGTEHAVWAVDDPNLTIMAQGPGGTGHLTAIDMQAVQAIYGTDAADGSQVKSWSWNAAKQVLTQTGFGGADAIRGVSVGDVIKGGKGNDSLFGLNGADTLYGGDGNDLLYGGPDADKLVGGAGDDQYFTGTGDKVMEDADGGYDTVITVVSTRLAANVEALWLYGGVGLSGTGNDLDNVIFGNGSGCTLSGEGGADYIVGGIGADVIRGGAGADVVYGQAGADRFVFGAVAEFAAGPFGDVIGDFSHAEGDRIDLRPIDPDAVTAGDQKFSFVGTADFTTDARFQLRWFQQGGDAVVQIDLNHDRVADVELLLYGVGSLVAGDFYL
jgi:Ca2+-binding RTX toxin-like protein